MGVFEVRWLDAAIQALLPVLSKGYASPEHGQEGLFPRESFDAVAEEYDRLFTNSFIGKAQRQSVWRELDCSFQPGQRVLEINCGTGVDAQHLAARGIHVVACDASPAMIEVARRRLNAPASQNLIDFRILAIEQIDQLESDGPYEGVFSNFAGLNCVENLPSFAQTLARMIRPGGKAILCLFGRCCLWEIFWYSLQGNIKKAFRRASSKGVVAKLAPGHCVLVRYPSLGALRRDFGPHFRLVNWKGVGIAVPPSYLEALAVRFPRLFRFAARIDPWLGQCRGVRALADHLVLVFERTGI
jgi:ubiquinone/menaquinone biosynthesis C-methylase UbiE